MPLQPRCRLPLPTLLFLGLLLLTAAALAVALPLPARAKGTSQTSAHDQKPTPHAQAQAQAAAPDRSGFSDSGPQPLVQGGPDSFGYTYADSRDPGGPPYTFQQGVNRIDDGAWVLVRNEMTATTPLDDGVITTTLPFNFSFYGTGYSQMHISTNGNVHFGPPNDYWPDRQTPTPCLPSTSQYVPRAMVAPLWFDFAVPDINSSVPGGVYTTTSGLAPNRTYIVEWRNVYQFGDTSVRATFEVVLSENGDITYEYAELGNTNFGPNSAIGIQNASGTVGLTYSCSQSQTPPAPQRAIRFRVVQAAFLRPTTNTRGGAPGATVAYTETLTNQTGVDSSFTLTRTGNLWNTTINPATTGTIPNGSAVPVTVSVQIPPDAPLGASDVVTITASSTVSPTNPFTATAVLTTSVTSNGIEFSPPSAQRAGDYGATVTYPVRLFNRTGQNNNFTLGLMPGNWPSSLTPTSTGTLAPNASTPLTVTVNIPANATLGAQSVLTVTATGQQPSPGSYFGVQVITTTAGLWRLQSDAPQQRSRAATVSFGSSGQVYLLGGETLGGDTNLPVAEYDAQGNRWYPRGTLQVGVSNAGAGVIGDAIYVLGGTTQVGAQTLMQVYYPNTDTSLVIQSDPLPEARFGAGVVALNNKLYVIGGADTSQTPKNTVFEYDPARPAGSRWQAKTPMPTARVYLGAASVDGIIYAVGGVNRVTSPVDLTNVEAYDPASDAWTVRAPLSVGRGGVSVVGVNSGDPGCGAHLYAIGGGYNTYTASAEQYDPATNSWRAVSNMLLARRTAAATYSPATRSLLITGGWNGAYLSETESVSCSGGVTYCTASFSDVAPYSSFYPFTRCLACRNILGGYGDGTFRPGNPVSRGQLSKIVSNAANFAETHTTQTYADVPPDGAFYVWVERLSSRGIIGGYACGGASEPCDAQNRPYFRPNANSSRGQISKIVANAANITTGVPPTQQTYSDVPPSSPFWLFIERLTARNVMGGYACGGVGEPCDAQNRPYFRPNAEASRGQTAKIVSNTFFPECAGASRP